MNDRGQSEVVGFVLVFGLIISTVAVASVAGFSGLQDARDFDRIANAERAFDVLAEGIDDVAHDGAPSRMTEMNADSAQVFVGESVTITVVIDPDGPSNSTMHEFEVDPIVYEGPDGTRLVYVAGAVIREDAGGAVVLREPDFMLGDDHTVIQVIDTQGPRDASIGSKTVRIRADALEETVVAAATGPSVVTLSIDSPRAPAWAQALESEGHDCILDGSTMTCEITTDSVSVSASRISIALS